MSSTSIESLNNLADITSGSDPNVSSRSATTTNYSNIESSSSSGINCCLRSGIWLVCDLYYGYTDDTCVSEPTGKLAINLKDYLLVYGWIFMSIIGLSFIALCFFDINSFGGRGSTSDGCFACDGSFLTIIYASANIFIIIWNIFGAIIFWGLMDTTDCSSSIYNYVFTSLIIKLVFNVIRLLQSKNDKDK